MKGLCKRAVARDANDGCPKAIAGSGHGRWASVTADRGEGEASRGARHWKKESDTRRAAPRAGEPMQLCRHRHEQARKRGAPAANGGGAAVGHKRRAQVVRGSAVLASTAARHDVARGSGCGAPRRRPAWARCSRCSRQNEGRRPARKGAAVAVGGGDVAVGLANWCRADHPRRRITALERRITSRGASLARQPG